MHRFICILCTSRSIKNYSIPYDFSDTFGVIFLSAISPVSYLHRGLAWFLISSNSVSGMSSVIMETIPALLLKSCHFTAALVNPGSSVQSMSTFLHATALSLLMCRLLSSLGRRPFWEPLLPLRLPTIDFNSVWTPCKDVLSRHSNKVYSPICCSYLCQPVNSQQALCKIEPFP